MVSESSGPSRCLIFAGVRERWLCSSLLFVSLPGWRLPEFADTSSRLRCGPDDNIVFARRGSRFEAAAFTRSWPIPVHCHDNAFVFFQKKFVWSINYDDLVFFLYYLGNAPFLCLTLEVIAVVLLAFVIIWSKYRKPNNETTFCTSSLAFNENLNFSYINILQRLFLILKKF